MTVLDIGADETGNQYGDIELAKHGLYVRHGPRCRRNGQEVAVTECRHRDEAEVDPLTIESAIVPSIKPRERTGHREFVVRPPLVGVLRFIAIGAGATADELGAAWQLSWVQVGVSAACGQTQRGREGQVKRHNGRKFRLHNPIIVVICGNRQFSVF